MFNHYLINILGADEADQSKQIGRKIEHSPRLIYPKTNTTSVTCGAYFDYEKHEFLIEKMFESLNAIDYNFIQINLKCKSMFIVLFTVQE